MISPFVLWINNDFDRSWTDADDDTNYDDSVTPAQGANVPDCNYSNTITGGAEIRMIPTRREIGNGRRRLLVDTVRWTAEGRLA